MPTVLWSNGRRDSAPTWQGLLDKIRADQPRRMSEEQFRRELDRRARLWSGYRIKHTLPPATLFQELAWAKMVVILDKRERA